MNEKAFPLKMQKYRNLNLINHSHFVILHFKVYKHLLSTDIRTISVRNCVVGKFENSL